ncbi:hypothetical protein JHD46_03455 [Sulfurimonas sp. SAG-AH-194-C20]|nr:hypothetical protein [Sulfurimonas sp. SAG-AH-194-C20]MDF1878692.1 hypothetical protein [Sulfurimonas sp. SAG-AH-194-C20]
MKKIVLGLSIFLSSLLYANELSWVDQQVNAIKPPRIGMKVSYINKIQDPFVFLEKNGTIQKETPKKSLSSVKKKENTLVLKKQKTKIVNKILVLSVVMNHSAMISGEWYKIGDAVNGFVISEINPSSVLLRKNKKQLLLSTKSNTNKLKFLNK